MEYKVSSLEEDAEEDIESSTPQVSQRRPIAATADSIPPLAYPIPQWNALSSTANSSPVKPSSERYTLSVTSTTRRNIEERDYERAESSCPQVLTLRSLHCGGSMYVIPTTKSSVSGAQSSATMMHASGYASAGHGHTIPSTSHHVTPPLHIGQSHVSYGFKVPEQHSSHSLQMYSPVPSQKQVANPATLRPVPHSPQVGPVPQSPHLMLNSHMASPHHHHHHQHHVSVPSPHHLVTASRQTPTHSPHLRSPSSHLSKLCQSVPSPGSHLPSHRPSPHLLPAQSHAPMASHPSRIHSVVELSQPSTDRESNAAPLDLSTSKPIGGEPHRIEPSPTRIEPPPTEAPRTDAPLDLSVKPGARKRDPDDDVIVVGGDKHIPFKARKLNEYTTPYTYRSPSMYSYMAESGYANGSVSDAHSTLFRPSHDHCQSRTPSRSGVIQSPQGMPTSSSIYPSDTSQAKTALYHRHQIAPPVPPGAQQMSRSYPEAGQQRMAYTYPSPTGTPYKVPSASRNDPAQQSHPVSSAPSEIRYPYPYSHTTGRTAMTSQHPPSASPSPTGTRYVYPSAVQPGSSSVSRPVSSQPLRQPPPLINPNATSGLSIPKSPRTIQERTVSYQQPSPNQHVSVHQRPSSRSGVHVIGNNTPGLGPASPKHISHSYQTQKHYSQSNSRMNTGSTGQTQWPPGHHQTGSLVSGRPRSITDLGAPRSAPSMGPNCGLSPVNQTMIRPPQRATLLRAESPRTMSHPPSPNQSQIRHYVHPGHQPSVPSSSSSSSHIDLTHGVHLTVPRSSQANPSSAEGQRPTHYRESDLRAMCLSRPNPSPNQTHSAEALGHSALHKAEMGGQAGQPMVRILPFQQTSIAQPVRVPQPGYLIRAHNTTGAPFMQLPGPHGPHSITVSLNPNQVGTGSSTVATSNESNQQQTGQTTVTPSSMASVAKPWPSYPMTSSDPANSRHYTDMSMPYNREDPPHSTIPLGVKKTIPIANVNPIIVQQAPKKLVHCPKKLMLYQSGFKNSSDPHHQQQKAWGDDQQNSKQGIVSKSQVSDGSGNNASLRTTFKGMLPGDCEGNPSLKPENSNDSTHNGDSSGKLDFSKLTRGLDQCPEPIVKMEQEQFVHFTENYTATELKIPVVPLKERMKSKDHYGRDSSMCTDYKKKSLIKSEVGVKKPKNSRPREKSRCKESGNAKIHRYYKVKAKVNNAKVKKQNQLKSEEDTKCKVSEDKVKGVSEGDTLGDNDDTEDADTGKDYYNERCEQDEKIKEKTKRIQKSKREGHKMTKKRENVRIGSRKQKDTCTRKDVRKRKESSGVVITARTRTQTAATKGVRRLSSAYNKNAAYERELKREEYRKLLKQFKRQTRQLGNRESRRVTRERLGVIFQSDTGSEDDDVINEDYDDVDDDDDDLDDDDDDDEFLYKPVGRSYQKSDDDEDDDDDFELDDESSRIARPKRRGNHRAGRDEDEQEGNGSEEDEDEQGSVQDQEEDQEKRGLVQQVKKSKRSIRGGRGRIIRRRGAAWYDKRRDRKKKTRIKEESDTRDGPDVAEAHDMAGQEVLSAPDMARRLVICKETGETLLHKAARLGHHDVVLYCLESGFEVNSRDNAGYTPLHETCVRGHVISARILIAHGADINANAHDGTRPMHDAVDNNNTEIVRMLLACGVDTKLVSFGGRNVMKLAKGDAMKEVLRGYFGDLNGTNEEKGFEEIPWKFFGSQLSEDPRVERGFAILEDVPSDPEDVDLDVEFDLSDMEHLPMYHLETTPNKGPRNYHAIYDVLQRLKMCKDEFVRSYPDVEIVEHYAPCLQHIIEEGEPLASTSGANDVRRKVSLVEATVQIKALLGVETETVHCERKLQKSPVVEVADDSESCHGEDTSRTESPGPTVTVLDPVNGYLKTQKVKDLNIDVEDNDRQGNDVIKNIEESGVEKEEEEIKTITGDDEEATCESSKVCEVSSERRLSSDIVDGKDKSPQDITPAATDSQNSEEDCYKFSSTESDKSTEQPCTELKDHKPEDEAGSEMGVDVDPVGVDKPRSDDAVSVCGTYVPEVTNINESLDTLPLSKSLQGALASPITEVKFLISSSPNIKDPTSDQNVCVHDSNDEKDRVFETLAGPMGDNPPATSGLSELSVSSTKSPSTVCPVAQLVENDSKMGEKEEVQPSISIPLQEEEGSTVNGVNGTAFNDSNNKCLTQSVKINISECRKPLSPPSSQISNPSSKTTTVTDTASQAKACKTELQTEKYPDLGHQPCTEPLSTTSNDVTKSINSPKINASDLNTDKLNCKVKMDQNESQPNGTGCAGVKKAIDDDICDKKSEDTSQSSDKCTSEVLCSSQNGTQDSSSSPLLPTPSLPQNTDNCDKKTIEKTESGGNPQTKDTNADECQVELRDPTCHRREPSPVNKSCITPVVASAGASSASSTEPRVDVSTTGSSTATTTTVVSHTAAPPSVLPEKHIDTTASTPGGELKKENNNNNVAASEENTDNGLPVLEKQETEDEDEAPENEQVVVPSNEEASDDREMPKLTIQAY